MTDLGDLRIPVAIRPVAEQVIALGVIPYIPDLGRDGTAAAMAAQRS